MGLHNQRLKRAVLSGLLCLWVIFTGACSERGEIVFTPSRMAEKGSAREAAQAGALSEEGHLQEQGEGAMQEPRGIYVYVCGAVLLPGVKVLPEGSRAVDALEMAGGFDQEADPAAVNLASVLEDGQKLYFPTREETKQQKDGQDDRINLNSADAQELQKLPGIGDAKASAIVKYRKENGDFKKPEELLQVPGISRNLYDRIKELIRLSEYDTE